MVQVPLVDVLSVTILPHLWGTTTVVGRCGRWWRTSFASSQNCLLFPLCFTGLCWGLWGQGGRFAILRAHPPANNGCWLLFCLKSPSYLDLVLPPWGGGKEDVFSWRETASDPLRPQASSMKAADQILHCYRACWSHCGHQTAPVASVPALPLSCLPYLFQNAHLHRS